MKKIAAGVSCVLLSVIIAVISVGCGGGGELTYTGEYQTNPTSSRSVTDMPSSSAETVLYQLTTQQGETVQVLSTTASTTEVPTMSYDPVTVPPMSTETTASTTVYVPPTYTPGVSNTVATRSTTTSESTTKKEEHSITYKSVNGNADGGVDGDKIKVWVDNIFGKKIKSKNASVTISYGTLECKANCKVSSELYAGEQVELVIGIPTAVSKAVESSEEAMICVTVPKGTILSESGVSNKEFSVTIYASDI